MGHRPVNTLVSTYCLRSSVLPGMGLQYGTVSSHCVSVTWAELTSFQGHVNLDCPGIGSKVALDSFTNSDEVGSSRSGLEIFGLTFYIELRYRSSWRQIREQPLTGIPPQIGSLALPKSID